MGALWISLGLGLMLGARHVFEPDHLAAVTVLAAERRGGVSLGMFWGIGHTLALLAMGVLLALLEAHLPEAVATCFELVVALMLIVLGLRAMWIGPTHVHPKRRRPFFVGLVHGFAGSGALSALIAAELPSWSSRLLFITVFGLASAVCMAALSGLAGWSIARIAREPAVAQRLSFVAGIASASLGVVWAYRAF